VRAHSHPALHCSFLFFFLCVVLLVSLDEEDRARAHTHNLFLRENNYIYIYRHGNKLGLKKKNHGNKGAILPSLVQKCEPDQEFAGRAGGQPGRALCWDREETAYLPIPSW